MKKEDLEFMRAETTAHHLKPAKAAQRLFWVITLFFIWCFVWAAFSEVDERIRGNGQIMPSGDIQIVQSLEGGILTELLTTEGAKVQKDQVLMRIDDIRFASEGRGLEAQMMSLKAKQARLKAEISGDAFTMDPTLVEKYPDIAATEEKLYHSRMDELKATLGIIESEITEAESNLAEVKTNINKYTKSRNLLQQELNITRRLVEKNAKPEIEKLQLERELNEASGNLASAEQSLQSLEARLAAAHKKESEKKSSIHSQALGELNEIETKIAAMTGNLDTANDRVKRAELKSPVAGTVHKIYNKTIGGVIEPAKKLVEIVPADNDLMIRARISPTDIAFLKPGQPVRVSVSAYDPQVYGTLQGKLERISADTVDDGRGNVFFEIDVRTDKNHLGSEEQPLPILAGMVAEAEVIVGKRTILSYLMKPVLRTKDRALTEK